MLGCLAKLPGEEDGSLLKPGQPVLESSVICLPLVFGAYEEELLMTKSIFRICHEMLFALL